MTLGVARSTDVLQPTGERIATSSAAASDRLPTWFNWVLTVALASVAGLGVSGLALAIAGVDSRKTLLFVGVPCVAALTYLARPHRARTRASRSAAMCAIGALVLAGASFAWNAAHAAEHVVVDGDPSVYLSTGRWIASHGNLEMNERIGPFATTPGIGFTMPGVFDESGTTLEFQFSHLLPALLADGHWVGGDSLMLIVPAGLGAIGLLTVYALASRALRRSWVALAMTLAYAVSLPFIFVSRDTFSESAMLPLLWGGLWLWTRAVDRRSLRLGVAAGLLLGATMCTRIDALVYLAPLPVALAILWVADRRRLPTDGDGEPAGRRPLRGIGLVALVAAVPPAALGTFDLAVRSTQYYEAARSEVRGLYALLLASAVAGLAIVGVDTWLARRGDRARARTARARHWLAWLLPAGATIIVLGLWLVRPHVQTVFTSTPNLYIAQLQQAQGLPVQPTRTYDEQTMQWLSWYLGPITILLAAVGAGLAVRHFVRGRGLATLYPALALGLGTALYVFRSSINPFQLWASRRYAPAAVPFLLVLAGATIVALARVSRRRLPPLGVAAVSVVAAGAVVGGSLVATWPIRNLSSEANYLDVATQSCGVLGPNAAVVAVAGDPGLYLGQALRSWCNIPVAWVPPSTTPATLTKLARAWAAEGRQLYVSAGFGTLAKLVPGSKPVVIGPVTSRTTPTPTVEKIPRHLMTVPVAFAYSRVPT